MITAVIWGGRLGLAIGVVAVTVLSLTPAAELPPYPGIWDKAQHFLAYGALGLCAAIGFPRRGMAMAAGISLVVLGAGLEIGQMFVAGREGDLADMLANGLGVALGLWAAHLARRLGFGAARAG